ncbi:MAG: SlyX family protein [Gammaproteobacteria bacterium]|nr:SlyX family protein [Gammaproteobacteria bacterium]
MSTTPPQAHRLDELETRLAFQDDLLNQLNEVVTRQDREILNLQKDVLRLRHQLLQLLPLMNASAGEETPPPHY